MYIVSVMDLDILIKIEYLHQEALRATRHVCTDRRHPGWGSATRFRGHRRSRATADAAATVTRRDRRRRRKQRRACTRR